MHSFFPNILTSLNLFSGFYALLASIDGKYIHASIAILLSLLFDIFDGRAARIIGTSSKFGKEYDSLADMLSFGVAPSILIYNFSLKTFSKLGWLACFLYTACVALRLARFNIKGGSTTYFEGLPSPAGGAILASLTLFLCSLGIEPLYRNWVLLFFVYFLSYLLISPIKYPAFKEVRVRFLSNFYFIVLFILMLILVATNPPLILLMITTLYILAGPFLIFKRKTEKILRKRRKENETS